MVPVIYFKVNDTDNITKSTDYLNFSVTVTDGGASASTVTMNGTSLAQIGATNVWYAVKKTSEISGCTAVTDGACTFALSLLLQQILWVNLITQKP